MAGTGPRFADREGSQPVGPAPGRGRVYLLGVEAARAIDRVAAERYGLPGIVLMENAALAVLAKALEMLGDRDGVAVVCGPGNNGGDGMALARHLANTGRRVRIHLVASAERIGGDAAVQLRVCRGMGIEPIVWSGPGEAGSASLIVDAMYGIGLSRALDGAAADAAGWMQQQRARGGNVLSIDVPSGLDAELGVALGPVCVEADATVTMAGIKPGLTTLDAQRYVGELSVGELGVPRALIEELGVPWEPGNGAGRGVEGV